MSNLIHTSVAPNLHSFHYTSGHRHQPFSLNSFLQTTQNCFTTKLSVKWIIYESKEDKSSAEKIMLSTHLKF